MSVIKATPIKAKLNEKVETSVKSTKELTVAIDVNLNSIERSKKR